MGLNKSKYEKYEINNYNVKDKLKEFYITLKKFSYEILDTPLCQYQKREKEFYKFRESKIDFLQFEYNKMEGLVYDYKIENKKVQEKVAENVKNSNNKYIFHLYKNNGKKSVSYEKGDCDIYWLNCFNKIHFYVIPEYELIKHGKIREKDHANNIKKTIKISTETSNWLDVYKFNYEAIDKERLIQLFSTIN